VKSLGLTPTELKILRKLSTPAKIQDYLDTLAFNLEKKEETLMSPRRVLKAGKAHCLEGALLAATALMLHGHKPLLLDFKTLPCDEEHVIALYKMNGYWGAISKTNHAILRFRDPIYKTVRELALSYFHEYYMFDDGKKTLRSYSAPFDLGTLGTSWITEEKDMWHISHALDAQKHFPIVPKENMRYVRDADTITIKSGQLVEWERKNPRT
jgi:hypothetical protein